MAIQLEDYLPEVDPSDPTLLPMSSVPLQFLTQVYHSPGSECRSKPVFVPPTLQASTCVNLAVDEEYTMSIVIRTKDSFTG